MTKDNVTGIVYTRNSERALIPAGVEGPLGDALIVSGLVYKSQNQALAPVGTFDLSTITTSVTEFAERRQITMELTFNKKYSRRSWISKLAGPSKNTSKASEVVLSGIETFPLGGGLLDRPITIGVATGTGAFVGAAGTASIIYNPDNQFYTFNFEFI